MSVEDLAQQVADSVRKVVAEAQEEAAKIVAAAEKEAEGIRARAEAEARDQVEGARKALEELTSRFGGDSSSLGRRQARRTVPMPHPLQPASLSRSPRPRRRSNRSGRAEAGARTAPEPVAEAPTSPPAASDDSQSARLVAMKMALDGASREEIDAELASSYSLDDRNALLDDVLAKAGK